MALTRAQIKTNLVNTITDELERQNTAAIVRERLGEIIDNCYNIADDDLEVTTDETPTNGSTNPVQSGGVYDADQALLPRDGSRAMLGALNMGQYNITEAIRILPVSGETITIGGGLGDTVTLDGTNVKMPNLTALQVLELDANNNIISVAKEANAATEQEVLDHTEGSKFASPATIKKHTMITKLSLYTNFA